MAIPNIIILSEKKFRFTDFEGIIMDIEISDYTFYKTYEEVYKACEVINSAIKAYHFTIEKLKTNLTDEEKLMESEIAMEADRGKVLFRKILLNKHDPE